MKKNYWLILTILPIVLLAGLIVEYLLIGKQSVDAVRLEDWSLYQTITQPDDKWVGTGDCVTNLEFKNLMLLSVKGEMKKLVLSGNYKLIVTPNYFKWSNEKFLGYNNDSAAICAVAGRYPLKAYEDKLLWSEPCTGGALESSIDCQNSERLIDEYFKIN